MILSLQQQTQSVDDLELPSQEGLSLWLKRLRAAGFNHGLLMETLKKVQEHGLPEVSVVIGRGTSPHHERTLLHRHYELMNQAEEGNRPLDFKDLGFGKDVQAGDLLLEIIQEGPGKAGTNVLGEKVPFKKEGEGHLPTIQGQIETEREGSKVQYRSKIDGFLWNNDPSILKVTPELTWPTSVNHHLGNIQTQHRVEIGGDIASGFSVQAGKGILVKGSVERNALCQSEGNIQVEGGVHKGANIVSNQEVSLRFAQGALISSGTCLKVSDYLYDCEVQCQGELISEGKARGGRGAIVGGVITSMKAMNLNSVGSANSLTTLAVGVDLKLIKDMGELLRELKWNKAELNRLLRRLPISLADPDFQRKVTNLPDHQKVSFKRLWDSIVELQGQQKAMEEQYYIMDQEKNSWPIDACISIHGPVVPDVKVLIGSCQFLVVDPLQNQKFYQKDGTIFKDPLP